MDKDEIKETIIEERLRAYAAFIRKKEERPEEEAYASWSRVEKLVRLEDEARMRRKRVRRFRMAAGLMAAASVIVAFLLSFHFMRQPLNSPLADLRQSPRVGDSISQICLIHAGHKEKVFSKDVIVKYDQAGILIDNAHDTILVRPKRERQATMDQLIVPKGRRAHLRLSDGTVLYVNAASRVVYPSAFDGDKREIALSGEAFLEVAPDSERPFIVHTDGLDVKVYGTAFNVNAYERNDISVVLVEGSVEVRSQGKEAGMLLAPSQMASCKDGVMSRSDVEVERYICWKDNLMLFEKESVAKALERLSRYYGVPIWYDDDVAGRTLSGKLDLRDSIADVLDIVSTSTLLRYRKVDGGYYFMR